MMKKLMHILFLSCMKATELLEKKLYFPLSIRKKMQLSMHKSMCKACTNYQKQNVLIEKAIEKMENFENKQTGVDIDNL